MTGTIAERVAAGAAFLDAHDPGWDQRIDLGQLDLHSPCQCVLGQLAVGLSLWSDILTHFDLRRDWERGPRPADTDLGFNAFDSDGDDEDAALAQETEEYETLTAEWRALIEARRAAP